MDTKTCNKCFRTKILEEFPKDKYGPGGFHKEWRRNTCKQCRAKYTADWKRRNGYISPSIIYREVGTRWKVLVRDNFTCQYCGAKAPEVHLEVDHLIPKSKGGSDTIDNLITSCWECNRGKRDSLFTK